MDEINKRLDDKEIKDRIFEVLVFVKQVCEENNIPYSLCYGTLLGAERHKGFIPWDDDVDVCMLRKDYERFIKIMKNRSGRFKIMAPLLDKMYYYNFAKVIDSETRVVEHGHIPIENYGIYVDIFPLDYCPDTEDKFKRLVKKVYIYSALRTACVISDLKYVSSKKKIAIMLLAPIAKACGYPHWLRYIDKTLRSTEHSEFVCCLTENPNFDEKLSLADIFPLSKKTFNGELFSCFNNSEKYLQNRYGDYMSLPPIEQRTSHHNYYAYKR